jgi:murein DD-endopeptidase MepM/ murein hydrolase activator NlpD
MSSALAHSPRSPARPGRSRKWAVLAVSIAAAATLFAARALAEADVALKGLDIRRTGLIPRYPADRVCPPITSLYASWDDVDGSQREEPHSGVDLGRLGDEILAPGPGTVVSAWKANWGWGEEGALLLRHSREELGLKHGPKFYYSEFDHLRYDEISHFKEGARVERGAKLATVFRPGGRGRYLPEVHWEVWQVEDGDANKWGANEFGGRNWTNDTAHLVDPLYMLSLNALRNQDGSVDIPLADLDEDDPSFRGFTYIFRCHPK